MHVSTDSTVSSRIVGAIDTVLIKTGGSGGTNGTHTGVAIRGDGSSGVMFSHRAVVKLHSYSYNCSGLYFCIC